MATGPSIYPSIPQDINGTVAEELTASYNASEDDVAMYYGYFEQVWICGRALGFYGDLPGFPR
jgi:hypothetical protein